MVVPTVPVAGRSAVAVLLHRPDLPVSRALRADGHGRRTAAPAPRLGDGGAAVRRLAGGPRRGTRAGSTRHTARACSRSFSPPAPVVAVVMGARDRTRGEHAAPPSRTGSGCSSCSTERRSGSSRPTPTDGAARQPSLARADRSDRGTAGPRRELQLTRRPRPGQCRPRRPRLASGREDIGRYRYLRPDGTITWVPSTAPRSGPPTEVTRWLGSVSDVTDQVEADALLADSERRYRSVVATMAEGVVLQDADGASSPPTTRPAGCWASSSSRCWAAARSSPRWRAVREDGSDFPAAERPRRWL